MPKCVKITHPNYPILNLIRPLCGIHPLPSIVFA
jgi:hypothetical protein